MVHDLWIGHAQCNQIPIECENKSNYQSVYQMQVADENHQGGGNWGQNNGYNQHGGYTSHVRYWNLGGIYGSRGRNSTIFML